MFLRTSRKLPWVGMEAAQHAALKAEVEWLLVEWKVLEYLEESVRLAVWLLLWFPRDCSEGELASCTKRRERQC